MSRRRSTNERGWDRLADSYQREVGWPDDDLYWGIRCPPESALGVLRGTVRGAATLVLGCGGGQDLVALSRLGAGTLTGLDVARAQLTHARARLDAAGVAARLIHGDAADLSDLPDERYDLVVSVQALDYVEDVAACLVHVTRVLRPGGTLAFSVLHPADLCTDDRPPHAWEHSYFSERRDWAWDGLTEREVPLRSWIRRPAAWFTMVRDAGLEVTGLYEPEPDLDPRWRDAWLDEDTWSKLDLVPGTIVVRARRPGP